MSYALQTPAPSQHDPHTRVTDLQPVFTACSAEEQPAWQALQQLLSSSVHKHCNQVCMTQEADCLRVRYSTVAGTNERRLQPGNPLIAGLELLAKHLRTDRTAEPLMPTHFICPVDERSIVFRCRRFHSMNATVWVIDHNHGLKEPAAVLDTLLLKVEQARQLSTLATERQGLILLAGQHDDDLMKLARGIAQSQCGPDRNIVIGETGLHPSVPRTWQIDLGSEHPNNRQLAWQIACEMPADMIIAPSAVTLTDHLARMAINQSLVIQLINSRNAAQTLTQALATGTRQQALSQVLDCIVMQYCIGIACDQCSVATEPTTEQNEWISQHSPVGENAIGTWLSERMSDTFVRNEGCESCHESGISHTTMMIESLPISADIRDAVFDGDIRYAIKQLNSAGNRAQTLLSLARSGHISLDVALHSAREKL